MKSYTHITLEERKSLQELYKQGLSIRELSRAVDRSPSTISRELKRNCNKNGTYHHWRAQILYITRRRYGPKRRRILTGTPLWNYIVEKLQLYWSPEEIVMRWKKEHPQEKLSFSTIYQYIKRGEYPNITPKKHLRRRGKRKYPRSSNFNTIHPDRLIPQWPEEIKERARIGDWEGDTIYGAVGKGLVVTCVDRKTRYLKAGLLNSRDATQTETVLVDILQGIPVTSLSLDNGSEFANFRRIEGKLQAPIYFAEPHKPWQRGTNENTNDILRFFFPKGTDFHNVTQEHLDAVVYLINTRPRKCLGWLSPFEIVWGVALD